MTAPTRAAPDGGAPTETASAQHPDLDRYDSARLVEAFIADQAGALAAVHAARGSLVRALDMALPCLRAGGRLVYVGAGTSGRLGVLDSVELWPTFSWPPPRAMALLAGGRRAMFRAVEGAEDDAAAGAAHLRAIAPRAVDVVLLLAASGTTPYVLGAADAAAAAGALTVAIVNNPGTPLAARARLALVLDTGSELIGGSTRLKAATAQKIVLNTLSSALMVRLHKVYGNLMVDLHPTNAKLYRRALAITMQASGADEAAARQALQASGQRVKIAVVMLVASIDAGAAESRLAAAQGDVRAAIARGDDRLAMDQQQV